MRVRLSSGADGSVVLESPYDAVFVQQLKNTIDYGGRQWDASRKRWVVSALYVDVLLAFLTSWGAQVQDDREGPGQALALPAMPERLKLAYDALYVQYHAPYCVVVGAFKALAKYTHPDKGGDVQAFQRINDAITLIRQELDPHEEGAR